MMKGSSRLIPSLWSRRKSGHSSLFLPDRKVLCAGHPLVSFRRYPVADCFCKVAQKRHLSGLHASATDTNRDAFTFGYGAENHNTNPRSVFSKYLENWTLNRLLGIDQLIRDDDPANDRIICKMTVDFMKRLEINSDRLLDLQHRVEDFHRRLNTLQRRLRRNQTDESKSFQDVMHVLEDERKILRNLQRLHFDTWESARLQYMRWSPDGDELIDNDDDCEAPIILNDPKQRKMRWNGMVQVYTEIQARHALTIEQMSELVIRLKPLGSKVKQSDPILRKAVEDGGESFDMDLEELYTTVCAFMRSRMTQQLLCEHMMAIGQDALGTSISRKMEAQKERERKLGKRVPSSFQSNAKVIGAISSQTPVAEIVQSSLTEASQLCEATYLISPPCAFVLDVQEVGDNESISNITTDGIYRNISATFVRSWLQYTLIELLKNAMAATVESNPEIVDAALKEEECFESDSDSDSDSYSDSDVQQHLPALYVHIVEDPVENNNILIQIYDQGGGIDEGFDLEELFRFAQRDTVWDRLDEQQTYSQVRSPLKGLGVGLSLSRWHMQHFGGDLTLERRPARTVKVRSDFDRRSKWHVLGKGMTVTIRLPKSTDIPLAMS